MNEQETDLTFYYPRTEVKDWMPDRQPVLDTSYKHLKKYASVNLHRTTIQVIIIPIAIIIGQELVSQLVFWAESTTKDYTTAKNNVQSVSYLLCTQVIKPQILQKPQNQCCTQIYIKENIHKYQTQNFWRVSPFSITPVEKAHKARTRWYRGPFRRFINTRFLKSIKKEWTEAIKKII